MFTAASTLEASTTRQVMCNMHLRLERQLGAIAGAVATGAETQRPPTTSTQRHPALRPAARTTGSFEQKRLRINARLRERYCSQRAEVQEQLQAPTASSSTPTATNPTLTHPTLLAVTAAAQRKERQQQRQQSPSPSPIPVDTESSSEVAPPVHKRRLMQQQRQEEKTAAAGALAQADPPSTDERCHGVR